MVDTGHSRLEQVSELVEGPNGPRQRAERMRIAGGV